MTTSTRYLGTCPVCTRTIKVRGGYLVHHGYTRPGYGYIEGDCFGVHMFPHESSSATARAYLDQVILLAQTETQTALDKEIASPSHSFTVKNGFGHNAAAYSVTAALDPYGYKRARNAYIDGLEYKLKKITLEVERLQGLIATWKPVDLTTVEEEKAAKQAVQEALRAERTALKAEKQAAKDARREKMLANRQARVEKVIAKHAPLITSATQVGRSKAHAAFIIQEACQAVDKASSDWSYSGFKALEVLGHADVFQKLGVEVPEKIETWTFYEILSTLKGS